MAEDIEILQNVMRPFGLFVTLALGILFFYLRWMGRKEPLTMSQKWALTVLAWLFVLNGIGIFHEIFHKDMVAALGPEAGFIIGRSMFHVNIIVGILLLMFGFVYPRPYVSWNRLRFILLGIMGLIFMLTVTDIVARMPDSGVDPSIVQRIDWYSLGYYIPVIIWLPYYEKERSPHVRTVMALFMWGFLAAPMSSNMVQFLVLYENVSVAQTIWFVIGFVLFFYTIVRLLLALWRLRSDWTQAEWLHLLFLGYFLAITMVRRYVVFEKNSYDYLFMDYMLMTVPWAILRPTLLSYAMLRYQIFGPKLRVDGPVTFNFTVSCAFIVLIGTVFFVRVTDPTMVLYAGLVLAILSLYPFWLFAKRMVAKLLPMSGGEEKASMLEKRTAYLMGLQTAVVDGAIDTEEDEVTLEKQRHMLGVTEREHTLLMNSFEAREGLSRSRVSVEELFLVHIDGRLMAHVTRQAVAAGKTGELKDEDIMAGMLVAIHGYVDEGLKKGMGASLETIKYGEYSLIIETSHNLVLAAVVMGKESPELRQKMSDELTMLFKSFGSKLTEWDGDHKDMLHIRGMLKELMAEL